MIFARLTPRNKADYLSLLLPHMDVLYAKALYWTRSRKRADRLLDTFLLRMTGAVEDMKKADNLRLWLVKSLYEDLCAQREDSARERLLDKDGLLATFFARPVKSKPLHGSPFALQRPPAQQQR